MESKHQKLRAKNRKPLRSMMLSSVSGICRANSAWQKRHTLYLNIQVYLFQLRNENSIQCSKIIRMRVTSHSFRKCSSPINVPPVLCQLWNCSLSLVFHPSPCTQSCYFFSLSTERIDASYMCTSKLRSPLPSPDRPLPRMRGRYFSVDATMPTMNIQYFFRYQMCA